MKGKDSHHLSRPVPQTLGHSPWEAYHKHRWPHQARYSMAPPEHQGSEGPTDSRAPQILRAAFAAAYERKTMWAECGPTLACNCRTAIKSADSRSHWRTGRPPHQGSRLDQA